VTAPYLQMVFGNSAAGMDEVAVGQRPRLRARVRPGMKVSLLLHFVRDREVNGAGQDNVIRFKTGI
jgi:hypothetical protein